MRPGESSPDADHGRAGQPSIHLPPRRGMWGPFGEDEFGEVDGYDPGVRRSRIDPFTMADAGEILDGRVPFDGHGGHRHGAGRGKAEFRAGCSEVEVVVWVRAIIDRPSSARPAPDGFDLYGVAGGTSGVLRIRDSWGTAWQIYTAHPLAVSSWPWRSSRRG